VLPQYLLAETVDFTESGGLHSGAFQPEGESSDA